MRQNYINFPINKQTGLSSGATQTLDAFNQVHAIVWFYCFFILGMIIILLINIYKQVNLQLHSFPVSINVKEQPLILANPYRGYDNWLVEVALLVIPFTVVVLICIPSTALSYSTGEAHSACASLKVTGEQWSWSNDLIVPVTKGNGYRLLDLNLLTEITKKYATLYSLLVTSNISTQLIEQQTYLKFGFIYDQLYDPTIEHINWVNFQFTQTKVLPYDKYTNNTNLVEGLQLNNLKTNTILNSNNLYLNNKGAIVNNSLLNAPLTGNSFSEVLVIINNIKITTLFNLKQVTPIMHDTTNIATAVPGMVWSKLVVDSVDVIHAYWLFEFGIKIDCIPGNPIQIYLLPKKFGISTGNCAEYCGGGHINMPITVKSYDITQTIQ